MLQAVLVEADMQNHGAKALGSGSNPAALLPCLITWSAKQSGWECVKPQYLSQQPGALTSCKASPVCWPASGWLTPWVPFFQEALCARGSTWLFWGTCQPCVLCSLLLNYTNRLIFFSLKDLNIWFLHFMLLALLWNNVFLLWQILTNGRLALVCGVHVFLDLVI
jgi:hypothetical protein